MGKKTKNDVFKGKFSLHRKGVVLADKVDRARREFPEYSQMVVSVIPNDNDSYRKVAPIFRTTDARKGVLFKE